MLVEGLALALNNSRYMQCSTYTNIQMQSILAVLSAQELNFPNQSYEGSIDTPKFREGQHLINVSIVQIQDGRDTVVATYISDLQELKFTYAHLVGDKIPYGRLRIIKYGSSMLEDILLLTIFGLSFVFITVNLILYLIFRKEPEVKATSVSVSMCMFLGSYLLVFFPPLLLLQVQVKGSNASATLICSALISLSGIRLPFSLILATLVVKVLRVYQIFSNPFSYKKKLFSDRALLTYILAILSPSILTLILMQSVDVFTVNEGIFHMKSHDITYHGCSNEHTIVWCLILLMYNICLTICLVLLALKSSKLRYRNFMDTKATNAFAYLSIFIAFLTTLYYLVFISLLESVEIGKIIRIILYVGHFVEALVCQVLLFMPKVFPPLMKRMSPRARRS